VAVLAILMEVIEMLHHYHIPEAYLWILVWFVAAMVLLLLVNALTVQPVIVAIH